MSRAVTRLPLIRSFTRLGLSGTRPTLLPLNVTRLAPLRATILNPSRSLRLPFFRKFSTPPDPNESSTPSSPSSTEFSLPEDATLSQRLKFLMKRYGWYALGVYLFFSVVDFTFVFGAINWLGAEYVSKLVEQIKKHIPSYLQRSHDADSETENALEKGGKESLYAMLVLAYTIHKTLFLPFRVGMTAAFTPRFVGYLGRRGWIGTDGARRAAAEMRQKMRRKEPRD